MIENGSFKLKYKYLQPKNASIILQLFRVWFLIHSSVFIAGPVSPQAIFLTRINIGVGSNVRDEAF